MMKFGANITQTAHKGLNLAQAGNYDHVLNLKYTCRALPSCFTHFWENLTLTFGLDLGSSSSALGSLNVHYWVVPWYRVWSL